MKQEQEGVLSNVLGSIAQVAFGLTFWPACAADNLDHRAAAAYPAGELPGAVAVSQRNTATRENKAELPSVISLAEAGIASSPAGPAYRQGLMGTAG